MAGKKERWECVFVDRIDTKGRIYLIKPLKYGLMYSGNEKYRSKIRYCIPEEIGSIKGNSEENKLIKAISIASAFNKNELKLSNGLILKGHQDCLRYVGQQSELVKSHFRNVQTKGSTLWLIYISPKLKFHSIINGKYLGEELEEQQSKTILNCIKDIENERL